MLASPLATFGHHPEREGLELVFFTSNVSAEPDRSAAFIPWARGTIDAPFASRRPALLGRIDRYDPRRGVPPPLGDWSLSGRAEDLHMDHYRSITARENRRRRKRLEDVRAVILHHTRARRSRSPGATSAAGGETEPARRELAEALRGAREIVAAAGVPTSRRWHPPWSSGHVPGTIDVLGDFLELEWYGAVSTWAVQVVDDAIGVYRRDARAARTRTLSPAWWLGRALRWLGRIASRPLRAAGLHPARFRASQLRQAILVFGALSGGTASILVILDRIR